MGELFSAVYNIIEKYKLDNIFFFQDKFYSLKEIKNFQEEYIKGFLSNLPFYGRVALYGGGKYCDYIYEFIKSRYENIIYIIDGKISGEKKEIPVIDISDTSLINSVDAIFITSWNHHSLFAEQLTKLNYQGKVYDIPEIVAKKFPNMDRPIYEYEKIRLRYQEINNLEITFNEEKRRTEKYIILKRIIYALLIIKDFYYAKKYIEIIEKNFSYFGENKFYRLAIKEIEEILCYCAKQKGEDVLFIHVIDSLSDKVIDQMKWLSKVSEEEVRIKGIVSQYPHTAYAMNTLFTGKSPFEIEMTGEIVRWSDSKLLQYLSEKKYSVNIASGIKDVMEEYKEINENTKKYPYNMIAEVLFEGLSLWHKKNKKNLIVIHSCGEIHSSFFRVGSKHKLRLCKDILKEEEFRRQFKEGVEYVDEQIEYYSQFYKLTNMPMVIMGDHGISIDNEINYFIGNRKDLTRGVKEILEPAMIITGIHSKIQGGDICSDKLISNTKIPTIILSIITRTAIPMEEITSDVVNLEFIPGYNEEYCSNFMKRGMWGVYEGFAGIIIKDIIYLVSQTGKRIYTNLEGKNKDGDINDTKEEYLIKLIKGVSFPHQIFRLDKYKTHIKLLKINDSIGYHKLIEALEAVGRK